MLPIIVCSIIALAIVAERFIVLKEEKVLPANLVADVWRMASTRQLTEEKVREIQQASPLGRVLACLLYTSPSPRDRQKSRMPSSA